jgi:hypothetical protein
VGLDQFGSPQVDHDLTQVLLGNILGFRDFGKLNGALIVPKGQLIHEA